MLQGIDGENFRMNTNSVALTFLYPVSERVNALSVD